MGFYFHCIRNVQLTMEKEESRNPFCPDDTWCVDQPPSLAEGAACSGKETKPFSGLTLLPICNNLIVGSTGKEPQKVVHCQNDDDSWNFLWFLLPLPTLPIILCIQMLFVFIQNSYDASPRPLHITSERKTHVWFIFLSLKSKDLPKDPGMSWGKLWKCLRWCGDYRLADSLLFH